VTVRELPYPTLRRYHRF